MARSAAVWPGSPFLSTPSARRATDAGRADVSATAFLSTPSARRATLFRPRRLPSGRYFYPRPPRGGRHDSANGDSCPLHFYPRPPRGGRPAPNSTPSTLRTVFLSTPSARRATRRHLQRQAGQGDFYPRPPRGGRLMPGKVWNAPHGISIHALREEGDLPAAFRCTASRNFYPRPPRGGRRKATS